ncbi:folate transporter [Holotrichia oblita]|uniref:Folate transporter n=1 Tax=Holotrichia oblita TaxID=644536 RepID=A0ACB9TDH5_HOLOL|nr:folate transporter [Holotrichia oblita]
MENWIKLSALLCIFGFLKEIRPSDPFIFEYLAGEWRNITREEVLRDVLPIATYSQLAQLIIVFLITDLSRYKPLIIVLGISGTVVWALLLWTTSMTGLTIAMIFHGTFTSTEIAYYTYIYAKVSPNYYQQVTSHTRAALLGGKSLSGILAQILISFSLMDFRELNYITFSAIIAAMLWTILLPSVQKSIYFHQTEDNQQEPTSTLDFKKAFSIMGKHFVDSYSDKYVLRWSIWWVLATAGYLQVQTYIQALWHELGNYEPGYNGLVMTALTIFGVVAALFAGILKFNWRLVGNLILVLWNLFAGGLVLGGAVTDSLASSYICYVLFGGLYQFMITVGSSEIAKQISKDSHGLVFGFNMFLALIIQTLLTLVVVTGNFGIMLEVKMQYWIYGIYFIAIGTLYIILGLGSWLVSKKDLKKTYS